MEIEKGRYWLNDSLLDQRVNSSQILILAGWTVINGRRTVGFD